MRIELINGDCIKEMKKIPEGSIDLVLTDPPYGATACKWDTVIPFEPMWEQLKRVTKKNGAIVLFGCQPFTSALVMSNPKMFKYSWIWIKSNVSGFANAKKRPLKKYEDVLVFSRLTPPYHPQGLRRLAVPRVRKAKVGDTVGGNGFYDGYVQQYTNYPINVLEFASDRKLHPTQKPVALMEYLIKTYTNEKDTVLDFTMGSGTTGVACKNLNRNFVGIELDKDYFDIASKRISITQTT